MQPQPHLLLTPEQVSERVILCGDPARVARIASLLQTPLALAQNREFVSMSGVYQGYPITVCSTGIGAPSAIIALEELQRCGARYFIRVGSAGALQPHIGLGELVVAEGAVRDDGGSASYVPLGFPAIADRRLVHGLSAFLQTDPTPFHCGVVRSHDSFYRDDEAEVCQQWHRYGVLAADMETAALLTVGRLRGVAVAAVLNNVVRFGADTAAGINDYVNAERVLAAAELRAAQAALAALCQG